MWKLVAGISGLCLALGGCVQDVFAETPRILSSNHGQFVFGQISEASPDQFLLDTKTGRLWRLVVAGPEKVEVLQEVYFLGKRSKAANANWGQLTTAPPKGDTLYVDLGAETSK